MALTTVETRTTWREYTADGSAKRFDIPFEFLDRAHIVVRDNDTKKTIVTDYTIDEFTLTNGKPEVVFGTAPTNAHTIRIARKTPRGSLYSQNPSREGLDAQQARFIAEELSDVPVIIDFQASQTDLLAGTTNNLDFSSPVDGNIYQLRTGIQLAVTTGGVVKVQVNGVDVVGATITVANGATKGTRQSALATAGDASTRVKRGDKITVVFDDAFATAGALVGTVEIFPDP